MKIAFIKSLTTLGKDGDFASVCVLLSTILSVVTIPLMYLVMSGIFGITVV